MIERTGFLTMRRERSLSARGFDCGVPAILVLAAALAVPLTAAVQDPAEDAPKSPALAAELSQLLTAKQLEAFAVRDPAEQGRFVAVLHIPGVQLLVVSAAYKPPTDMDYKIDHKSYMDVYMDLNSSVQASQKTLIEDVGADGLNARPPKDAAQDSSTLNDTQRLTFDGVFTAGRKHDDSKPSQAAYMKSFGTADAAYARLLGVLIEGLKKGGL